MINISTTAAGLLTNPNFDTVEGMVAVIFYTLLVIGLLCLIAAIKLLRRNNKKEEEQLRQQSIVIKHLTEEVEEMKEVVAKCAAAPVKAAPVKKAPVAKKAPVKKAAPKKAPAKKPAPKKAPAKKEETLTKEQIAKRDAQRAALAKKAEKAAAGKKLTAAQLKQIKLTDLFGVAEKRAQYYADNGRDDMVKLSKMPASAINAKFIENFPALKSWTAEKKKASINANIAEAKAMVEMLTK